MNMEDHKNANQHSFKTDTLHLREEIEKYLFHWKWFLLGLIIAIGGAYIYLRYTPKQYKVQSTILIQDKDKESFSSELSAFKDLGLVASNNSMFDTEMGILKSRGIMSQVVKTLDLNISYFRQGRIIKTEVYQDEVPFKLIFFENDTLIYEKDTIFTVKPISNTEFNFLDNDGNILAKHSFGENISSPVGDFMLTPSKTLDYNIGIEYMVQIAPIDKVIEYYQRHTKIVPVDKRSSLVSISLEDRVRKKAILILKTLIEQYNFSAINDKSKITENTDKFINERINAISEELTLVDKDVETFKSSNQLTDMGSEASLILKSSDALEKEIVNISTQIKLVDFVSEHIEDNSGDLIPANLGLDDVALNQSTLKYNELLLERNRILQSSSTLNPVIVNLDDQITKLRASIAQSLVNLKSSLTISLQDFRAQEFRLRSKITSVPKQEREFRDIQRQQQIIETLYLYLLQKREENAITLAATEPNAKIIDVPFGSKVPVSPRKLIIYPIALLLGLVVPFICVYLVFLLDNKVHHIEDIENALIAPVLGDVPKTKKSKHIIEKDETSPFAESFRIIRTNVYFMLSKLKDSSKSIFISSTINGEGKTLFAINLAKALSFSSKKVLLIGGDIRNPKLAKYLNMSNKEGLTHYLMDSGISEESLIESVDGLSIDLIQSGIIPPNPSELLMNERFDELLNFARENYDYIVVDTAPVNMVTDTLLLSENRSDLFIYLIRANYLDKRLLRIPSKLSESNRIQNMALVLNDADHSGRYGYGYGYGYGVNSTKKPLWKRLFT